MNTDSQNIIEEQVVVETTRGEQEVHESVQFSDQAPIVTHSEMDNTLMSYNPFNEPTLAEYLSRVYPIQTVTWTSASAQGTLLFEALLPGALLANRALFEKVSRFAYLQAKFHISIRVNGTAFHYGKLMIGYNVTPYQSGSIDYNYRNNLYSASAYPVVLASPGQNEVQEFDIPFIYPLDYYPLANRSGFGNYVPPIASVFVYVLNPLRAGSGTVPNVTFTLYGNMYDVKVCGYSNTDITPFEVGPSKTILDQVNARNPCLLPKQVGLPPIEEEFQAQIGTTRMKLANPDYNKTDPDGNTMDLLPTPTLPTDDEASCMIKSFDEIIQREGILTTGTITAAAAAGTDLVSISVNPYQTINVPRGNGVEYYPTPLSHMAKAFNGWRGSIRYKLQIISSRFHSIRLQLLYYPKGSVYNTNEPYELSSRIFDIQQDTEFKFSIPYASILPYLDIVEDNGFIVLKVVNPLTFKESTIPPIEYNLWMSAGPDFEFLLPKTVTDYLSFDTLPSTTTTAVEDQEFKAQIGTNNMDNDYPSLVPFSSAIPSMKMQKVTMESIITKSNIIVLVDRPTTNGTYNQSNFYPEGYFQVRQAADTEDKVNPFYFILGLVSRFRRGSSTFIINPRTLATVPTNDYQDNIYTYTWHYLVNNDLGYHINRYASTVSDITISTPANSVRSSNLALQPQEIRIPYFKMLKFAMNNLCDDSTGGGSISKNEIRCLRSTLRTASSSDVEISCAGGADMKFFFQVGPPYYFLRN